MNVRIVNKSEYRAMPWANGRGVTTELYLHTDAQTGRMLWRLSIAGVDADGPFSHFPGYNRVLVLLEGAGLTLDYGDGTVDRLSRVYELAAFPGDVPTQATLVNGPIRDFNLIADRRSYTPAVTIATPDGNSISVNSAHLAIFAVDNRLQVVDPASAKYIVPQGDLLLIDTPVVGEWVLSGATAIVIQVLTGSN